MNNANPKLNELKQKANKLPLSPGVYIMRDKGGNIIYIGKAVQLKNRVSQYFGAGNQHGEKVHRMVLNVNDFEYILCDSEFEALILENSLIKQHQPKYNILLKDDKGYHYIKVTKGDYPKISAVKQIDDDGAEYIGPYNSAFVVKKTVDEVCKAFSLPQCSKTAFGNKTGRPCLNYHIGMCSAPCCGKITAAEYRDSVAQAVKYIKGGAADSVKELKRKMEQAAENLQFERAARLRDKIRAVEKIKEKQKVIYGTYERQDVIAFAESETNACFEVFVFKNSKLCDREEFITERVLHSGDAYGEFLRQYYSLREIPPRVAVAEDFGDRELTEKYLSEKAERKVTIAVPQKGEQLKLTEMCRANAFEALSRGSSLSGKSVRALKELADLLGLAEPPKYIEAYDISNTAGSENVGAMVTFLNGEPHKAGYRLFKIKGFEGQDDYRSMAEVITRRFTEYVNAENRESGFGKMPDLILLDGGAGQLSVVKDALKQLGITVPVFGMVKDSAHKTRAVASDGGEIAIKANRLVYSLLFSVQEEVHRFAISFHKKRRSKKTLGSDLRNIPGVGEVTAKKLLSHFKSVKAIRKCSAEDLASLSFINAKTANNIYEYYHSEDNI